MRFTRFSKKKAPRGLLPHPAHMLRRGIGEFSPTALFQLEKNLQHAPHLVAAGMPLLLGLILCTYLSNVPTAPMKLVGGGFEPWTFCLPQRSANITQEAGGWRI